MAFGLIDAAGLLTFFVAMRTMNVAVAMFLSYLAPIYVAVAAPRVLHQPTERVVYLSLLVGPLRASPSCSCPAWSATA